MSYLRTDLTEMIEGHQPLEHAHPAGTDPGSLSSELPVYSIDDIANQLTNDFWGGTTYSFDVSTRDALTVDLSALAENGQNMARIALEAWSEVTGLAFLERTDAQLTPSALIYETVDAASGTFTAYSMSVGENFEGSLSGGADRDAIAVSLVAGQSITIALDGDDRNGNALADPFLRLRDDTGTLIFENDDANGVNSMLSFQAPTSGTYYIQAGAYLDGFLGDYTLSVRETISPADITFQDDDAGAYAQFWTSGTTITRATINIDETWAGGSDRLDGYFYQTYLHEIGHALGLGHAGDYNGSADFGTDNTYLNDSWQASVMSYFHQTENTWLDASFAYAITPQVADIVAVQNLYGTAENRTGDDTYGHNANTGGYLDGALSLSNPVTFTVFDTGGADVFDFSEFSANQTMDLREEAYSDLAGLTGNIGIARGTIIEYGLTGNGDDAIFGNASNNGLSAGDGADVVSGDDGNDAIRGQEGDDTIAGNNGRDIVEAGNGNDAVLGGNDGDLLIGDDITFAQLIELFPTWTPEVDSQALFDGGDLLAVWDDIMDDVFGFA